MTIVARALLQSRLAIACAVAALLATATPPAAPVGPVGWTSIDLRASYDAQAKLDHHRHTSQDRVDRLSHQQRWPSPGLRGA